MEEEEKNINSETVDNEVPEGIDYNVFAENGVAENKEINRDYLNRYFDGGINIQHDTVTFTRTMYSKMYLDIEEHFETQRKDIAMWIRICQLVVIAAVILAFVPIIAVGLNGLSGLILYLYMVFKLVFPFCIEMCIRSYIKKFTKLKKEREKSIQRLNERREEAMIAGTYDAKF